MSSRVVGLGHVGIFVQDLDHMSDFYEDFMGMHPTKSSEYAAFFSSDPARSDHEIALLAGRKSLDGDPVVQQISMQVETLDDLRDFVRRIKEAGLRIDHISSHVSAIGCYFRDPEDNPIEVFWLSGLDSWVVIARPIEVDRPDSEIMAELREWHDVVGHVGIGEQPDEATIAAMRR